MASVERQVIEESLTAKGFKAEVGAKHDLWWYYRGTPPRKTRVRIAISRGKQYRTLDNDLVKFMARALGLNSLGAGRRFLVCEMTVPEWEQVVGPGFGWQGIPQP